MILIVWFRFCHDNYMYEPQKSEKLKNSHHPLIFTYLSINSWQININCNFWRLWYWQRFILFQSLYRQRSSLTQKDEKIKCTWYAQMNIDHVKNGSILPFWCKKARNFIGIISHIYIHWPLMTTQPSVTLFLVIEIKILLSKKKHKNLWMSSHSRPPPPFSLCLFSAKHPWGLYARGFVTMADCNSWSMLE